MSVTVGVETVIFLERWPSRPHYEGHLARRVETGMIAQTVGMLEGEPGIRYSDAIDA